MQPQKDKQDVMDNILITSSLMKEINLYDEHAYYQTKQPRRKPIQSSQMKWVRKVRRRNRLFPHALKLGRLVPIFLSIELTAEASWLLIYSNSALFKDSQVDMVSYKEIEPKKHNSNASFLKNSVTK